MGVPDAPGLGVEIDEGAIERYRVEEGYAPPRTRSLYRVVWPNGDSVVYPAGRSGTPDDGEGGLRRDFGAAKYPVFHAGVRLEIVPDDGSATWEELNQRAQQAPVIGA
jgi:hypothetical protein